MQRLSTYSVLVFANCIFQVFLHLARLHTKKEGLPFKSMFGGAIMQTESSLCCTYLLQESFSDVDTFL